jgi:hypothetical protein
MMNTTGVPMGAGGIPMGGSESLFNVGHFTNASMQNPNTKIIERQFTEGFAGNEVEKTQSVMGRSSRLARLYSDDSSNGNSLYPRFKPESERVPLGERIDHPVRERENLKPKCGPLIHIIEHIAHPDLVEPQIPGADEMIEQPDMV